MAMRRQTGVTGANREPTGPPRGTAVVSGDSVRASGPGPAAAIVLAAGMSSRMEGAGPKSLLSFRGRPVLGWIASALQRCQPRLIVTGPHHDAIVASPEASAFTAVRNPFPSRGQLSSLQTGLEQLGGGVSACVVALSDQPLLSTATVDALLKALSQSRDALAVPRFRGTTGHPVVIGSGLFAELLAAPCSWSMREALEQALQACNGRRIEVETADASILWNINTPAEREAIERCTCYTLDKR